jgi:hypothetical protein
MDTIFADDYNVAEAMTRHRSRHHGIRHFPVVQGSGVTVLRVRIAFAAAHWLTYGGAMK